MRQAPSPLVAALALVALEACTLRNYQLLDGAVDATPLDTHETAREAALDEALSDAARDEQPSDTPAVDASDEARVALDEGVLDAPTLDTPFVDAPTTDASADDARDETPGHDALEPLDASADGSLDTTPDTAETSPAPDSSAPPDVVDAAPACAAPRVSCGASCIDPATDVRHCGRCDNPCSGTANGAAVCAAGSCGLRCDMGFVPRAGACAAVPAPRLVWPPSGSVDTSQRPLLRWELPSGVEGALVEVCSTRSCGTVAQSAMATGSSLTLPTPLAAGVWFWRVRGRSGSVTGTAASATWQLEVEPLRAMRRSSAWGQRFDANGDGRSELASATSGGLRLYLHRGASLHDVAPMTLADAPAGLASGDFNGDGFGDLALYFDEPRGLRTVFGRSDLVAGAALSAASPFAVTWPAGAAMPTLVAAGDLDGDGYGDLLAYVREVADGVYWWRGSSTGLRSARLALVGSTPQLVHDVAGVGDVDGDGASDLVVTHPGGAATLWFGGREGPTEGLELLRPSGFGAEACAGAAGDMDGDGYPDFALGYAYAPGSLGSGTVLVYRGGDRSVGLDADPWAQLQEPDTLNAAFAFGTAVQGLGDSNGDGRDDLVVVSSHMVRLGDRVTVLSELTTGVSVLGSFELPGGTDITDGLRPRVVALGRVDGDARPEFAVGSPANRMTLGSVHLVSGTLLQAGVRAFAAPMSSSRYGELLAFAAPRAWRSPHTARALR